MTHSKTSVQKVSFGLYKVTSVQVDINRAIKKINYATRQKKELGIGAVCDVLKRFLHPRAKVCERYPNTTSQERLRDLLVIRREIKKVNKQDKRCIVFRHSDFENVEIYCAERYARVLTEGSEADFFNATTIEAEVTEEAREDHQESQLVPQLATTDLAENIA